MNSKRGGKHKITKVLIANRGEIALRIQRACAGLGINTVSIASAADKELLFARKAQELVVIGPAAAAESYLAMDKIIKAACERGCNAVHPGYGFLSENAEFARRVQQAGLIFIGPEPVAIATLGNKVEARRTVAAKGVPCVPGVDGDLGDEGLASAAKNLGFPIIIKAVAGGGGRGMRVAASEKEMRELLPRARAEAKKFFADERVYFERYVERPRHVEVQVFGDRHGNVVHFGTRDCSVQRRHQKLVEEAPAPNLDAGLRERIHEAALRAAQSVAYSNAGTAEFLVSGSEFYFLEMNTRIQVEHPVSEAITGVDLVQLQIRCASGEKLPYDRSNIRFSGHAIEFRIYGEDPSNEFAPSTGKLTGLKRPKAEYLREDYAYEEGDTVSVHYDALLSKVIVIGEDRAQAIMRSKDVLRRYKVQGIASTVDFHRWLLDNESFLRCRCDIGFVEREFSPQKLAAVRAQDVRDPRHQKPIGGAEVKSLYEYTSKKFSTTYTIEILHRQDGFFLAIPTDSAGRRAPNKNCRMSNGLHTVVESLITDVLENTSPAEVFGEA